MAKVEVDNAPMLGASNERQQTTRPALDFANCHSRFRFPSCEVSAR